MSVDERRRTASRCRSSPVIERGDTADKPRTPCPLSQVRSPRPRPPYALSQVWSPKPSTPVHRRLIARADLLDCALGAPVGGPGRSAPSSEKHSGRGEQHDEQRHEPVGTTSVGPPTYRRICRLGVRPGCVSWLRRGEHGLSSRLGERSTEGLSHPRGGRDPGRKRRDDDDRAMGYSPSNSAG